MLKKIRIKSICYLIIWRRGRDSNPRYPCEYAAFRVRCFQPLSHLSGARNRPLKGPERTALCSQARQDRQGSQSVYWLPAATRSIVSMAMDNSPVYDRIRKQLPGIFITLALVGVLTAILFFLVYEVGLAHGSIVYLIPVVIAATRWGIVAALVAAVCGVFASAFFFYAPAYSFRVKDPQEVIDRSCSSSLPSR